MTHCPVSMDEGRHAAEAWDTADFEHIAETIEKEVEELLEAICEGKTIVINGNALTPLDLLNELDTDNQTPKEWLTTVVALETLEAESNNGTPYNQLKHALIQMEFITDKHAA